MIDDYYVLQGHLQQSLVDLNRLRGEFVEGSPPLFRFVVRL
ncbi:MAG: hypothetical protein KatS3mg087_1554 [Patescibacteria group bacterium]|nr:MAG: hypothetical protein KatS3mg087_1554 [Patescibacteria group bacterium]